MTFPARQTEQMRPIMVRGVLVVLLVVSAVTLATGQQAPPTQTQLLRCNEAMTDVDQLTYAVRALSSMSPPHIR